MEKDLEFMWNIFDEMILHSDISKMDEIQRKTLLCYQYNEEMHKGGHWRYFENKKNTDHYEVVKALKFIGAVAQADILLEAIEIREIEIKHHEIDPEDYYSGSKGYYQQSKEIKKRYEKLDDAYFDCDPDMDSYLLDVFEKHYNRFVCSGNK